ncbi:MAG: hypothetical protein PHF00_13130, partial [Elusimicrobia bacterium]|nr:hypothetical protein [Elusimicrobiota bacterium]
MRRTKMTIRSFASKARDVPLLLLLLSWPAGAQDGAYSLSAAVEAVLRRSPGVQGATLRVREAAAALREVQGKSLPELSVNGAFTRGDQPVYA